MGQADWDLLAKRRSCSLLARRAFVEGGTATTPTTASVVGAMQAQEVVKQLHGLESLRGRGFVFEGLTHNSFTVGYPVSPDCPWHEKPADIEAAPDFNRHTKMREIWEHCSSQLGGLDAIDLSRELVETLSCPGCGQRQDIFKSIELVLEEEAVCDRCGVECVPQFFHSLSATSRLLDLTPEQLGLPLWDVVWPRHGMHTRGIELSGDRALALSTEITANPSRPR
jgi:adenylyltransferase/sulfurtransferase